MTPPVRQQIFESEVNGVPVVFVRFVSEWVLWFSNVSRGLGDVRETLTAVATLDFPAVAAQGTQDLTMAVSGARISDANPIVSIGVPAGMNAGLIFHGWVSANDTVTIRCSNITTGAINPAAAQFRAEIAIY